MADNTTLKGSGDAPFSAIAPTLRQLAKSGSQTLLDGTMEAANGEADNLRVKGIAEVQNILATRKVHEVEIGAKLNVEIDRLKAAAADELKALDITTHTDELRVTDATQTAIDILSSRVAAYRDALDAHFAKIDRITDPSEILRLIDARPEPPDLSTSISVPSTDIQSVESSVQEVTPTESDKDHRKAAAQVTPQDEVIVVSEIDAELAANPLIARLQGMHMDIPEARRPRTRTSSSKDEMAALPEAAQKITSLQQVDAVSPIIIDTQVVPVATIIEQDRDADVITQPDTDKPESVDIDQAHNVSTVAMPAWMASSPTEPSSEHENADAVAAPEIIAPDAVAAPVTDASGETDDSSAPDVSASTLPGLMDILDDLDNQSPALPVVSESPKAQAAVADTETSTPDSAPDNVPDLVVAPPKKFAYAVATPPTPVMTAPASMGADVTQAIPDDTTDFVVPGLVSDAVKPPTGEMNTNGGLRGMFGLGKKSKPDQKSTGNPTTSIRVVVTDLPDARDRRAFRGALGDVAGIHSAKLSDGPDNDCTILTTCDVTIDMAAAIMNLPGFLIKVRTQSADGIVVSVAPEDPFDF